MRVIVLMLIFYNEGLSSDSQKGKGPKNTWRTANLAYKKHFVFQRIKVKLASFKYSPLVFTEDPYYKISLSKNSFRQAKKFQSPQAHKTIPRSPKQSTRKCQKKKKANEGKLYHKLAALLRVLNTLVSLHIKMPGRSKFLPNWTDFLGRFSSSIPHWLVCLARVNAYHCHKSPLRCTRAIPQGHPAESHPKAGPFIEQLFNKYGLNERGPPHTRV